MSRPELTKKQRELFEILQLIKELERLVFNHYLDKGKSEKAALKICVNLYLNWIAERIGTDKNG